MARSYIVDNTATQVADTPQRKVIIQVNKTDTQSVKVIDGTSGTTANVATIATLVVGDQFEYYNFTSGVRIIASGACDVTVSTYGGFGAP